MLLRRRALLGGLKEIKYIKSTGTQKIDTLITPSLDIVVKIKFAQWNDTSNYIIGACPSDSTDFRIFVIHSNGLFYFDYGTQRRTFGTSSQFINGTVYEMEFGNYYLKKDGVTIINVTPVTSVGTSQPITIFGGYANVPPIYGNFFTVGTELHYLKIYKGGSLVRDFIPVLDADDIPCLYDYVSDTLFYNSGTGIFEYEEL